MAKAIFKKTDPQVKENAIALSYEQFEEKYLAETTASKTILLAVYNHFSKERANQKKVTDATTDATTFTSVKEHIDSDGDTVTTKKSGGTTIVEVDNKKAGKGKVVEGTEDNSSDGKKDKPGRTPRMRELIKGVGKDKQKVKAALDAEGFNTTGSGFHSEWNRVSKK